MLLYTVRILQWRRTAKLTLALSILITLSVVFYKQPIAHIRKFLALNTKEDNTADFPFRMMRQNSHISARLTSLDYSSENYSKIGNYSADPATPIFVTRKFVIWTTDFHVATIRELKDFLSPFGVEVIDYNFGVSCNRTRTCGHQYVKSFSRAIVYGGRPNQIEAFYNAYKNDSQMLRVDAIAIFYPFALLEFYRLFNKTLFLISPIRYEAIRNGEQQWKHLNEELLELSQEKRHLIGANNLYDLHYIKYFTGISGEYIPSYCGYTNASYSPSRPGFLFYGTRGNIITGSLQDVWTKEFSKHYKLLNCTFDIFIFRQRYQRD